MANFDFLDLTGAQIEEALKSVRGHTTGANPATAETAPSGTETVPLFNSGSPEFITTANLRIYTLMTNAEVRTAVEAATDSNVFTDADHTKLDYIAITQAVDLDAVEALANDAVLNADTSTAAMSFVVDEDTLVSDLDTKVPTQQSVKAYVDNAVTSNLKYQGAYDASTNSPDLDTSPISGIKTGHLYVVSVGGTFFTLDVDAGDIIISNKNSPSVEADWDVIEGNLTPAIIKTKYESNADTNAFTDAYEARLISLNPAGITTDLDPSADDARDLGSGALRWRDIHAVTVSAGVTAADTFKLRGYDVDGTAYVDYLTITSGNSPTADLHDDVTHDGNVILTDDRIGASGGVQAYNANYVTKNTVNSYSKSQYAAYTQLTDGATIDWDLSINQHCYVVLDGNRTLNTPTNITPGIYIIEIIQDAVTGSRTLTWPSEVIWSGSAPTLSTAVDSKDIFTMVSDGTSLYAASPVTTGTGDLLADGSIPLTANWDVGAFTITGTQFISDIATGTAPFVVSSTTEVANLKAATASLADSVEGTAVLSTGEVGGTKFLREDGDGTCSWQTVAGGGDDLGDHTATEDLKMADFNVTGAGSLFMLEKASADADVTGYGQLWASTAPTTPLRFTDEGGTDYTVVLGSTNQTISGQKDFSVAQKFEAGLYLDDESGDLGGTANYQTLYAQAGGVLKLRDGTGTIYDASRESIVVAASDETTALTTGDAKLTFRMPYAFTLEEVRASVTTAPTGATITVDIEETGTTILSTLLTIDATEKTSTTAAAAAVISDSALADDAEITINIDQVGSTIAGAGLKIYLIGRAIA